MALTLRRLERGEALQRRVYCRSSIARSTANLAELFRFAELAQPLEQAREKSADADARIAANPPGQSWSGDTAEVRRLGTDAARVAGCLRLCDCQHGQRGAGWLRFAGGRYRAGRQVLRAKGAEGHGPRPGTVAVARDGGGTGPARPGVT